MQVVIIADFATASGGAQSVAIQSAAALAERGVDITYLHAIDAPVDPRLGGARIRAESLGLSDVWDVSALRGAADGIWNRRAASRLRSALSRLPPGDTVLHLHQWTRSFSPSIFPMLLGSGHPLVITLHDYFLVCPNGVYYRFDRGEPCTLRPLSLACITAPCDPRSMAHKAVRVLRSAATRAGIGGRAFDVVHVSDRGRETVAPFLPAGLGQHRIDNPVEIGRREPSRPGKGSKIAYIGRLTREKGAHVVAEAARAAGLPSLFVGDGPAESEIRAINPGAELLGWRSRDEVDRLLRSEVRAVAAPSLWFETGPLTIYEALAAGVPVVASRRSGAAEKVSDGETGFVVEPTAQALAGAFRSLSDPHVADRMGRAAYDRYWQAPLSVEAHTDALMTLYAEMRHRERQA